MGEEEQEVVGEGESYQLEMMRCLREVNADNNTVGWCVLHWPLSNAVQPGGYRPFTYALGVARRYQSTISGSFQVVEIIETFVSYMESLERCVCIVYDITAAAGGALGLKAIRLSDAFVEAYREGVPGARMPARARARRCSCPQGQEHGAAHARKAKHPAWPRSRLFRPVHTWLCTTSQVHSR